MRKRHIFDNEILGELSEHSYTHKYKSIKVYRKIDGLINKIIYNKDILGDDIIDLLDDCETEIEKIEEIKKTAFRMNAILGKEGERMAKRQFEDPELIIEALQQLKKGCRDTECRCCDLHDNYNGCLISRAFPIDYEIERIEKRLKGE